mmetsp:Transcript_6731/g.11859  ORF Transcript_6731/g.11859 Transcript_6731/m.11859 type:complete len:87 (+) Transcript_6731:263-523(+)
MKRGGDKRKDKNTNVVLANSKNRLGFPRVAQRSVEQGENARVPVVKKVSRTVSVVGTCVCVGKDLSLYAKAAIYLSTLTVLALLSQ